MKRWYAVAPVFLFCCFQNRLLYAGEQAAAVNACSSKKINDSPVFTDSTGWMQSLLVFRNAVSAANKQTVKSFFNFPLTSTDNNIWRLVYEKNEPLLESLPDQPKSFTEQDFDIFFTRLFPAIFTNGLLHLNLDRLLKKNECETVAFRKNAGTTYKMYATVDNAEKTLTLSLAFHTMVKNKKAIIEDNEEYGTLYVFAILPDGKLQFKKIVFTG